MINKDLFQTSKGEDVRSQHEQNWQGSQRRNSIRSNVSSFYLHWDIIRYLHSEPVTKHDQAVSCYRTRTFNGSLWSFPRPDELQLATRNAKAKKTLASSFGMMLFHYVPIRFSMFYIQFSIIFPMRCSPCKFLLRASIHFFIRRRLRRRDVAAPSRSWTPSREPRIHMAYTTYKNFKIGDGSLLLY